MAKKRSGHVRLACPHCHKSVNVQRPQGFQRSVPCPNCRIPITADVINAAESAESTQAPEAPEA